MNGFSALHAAFETEKARFLQSSIIRKIVAGDIHTAHYAQMLRQVFHQARENPQLQALATVRLRGSRREAVPLFCRHAASEAGHDELALADYAACGYDPLPVREENPHPATSALTGFAFHQVCNRNPVSYLGYLFFLEFLPTSTGAVMIEKLKQAGVPANAFRFMQEHVTVDVAHNRAMERYCELLIRTTDDLAAATYALRATGYLYAQMLAAAASQVEQPVSYGYAVEEALEPVGIRISDEDLRGSTPPRHT